MIRLGSLLLAVLLFSPALSAQGGKSQIDYGKVSTEVLTLDLKPLDKAELEVEAKAAQATLKAQVKKVTDEQRAALTLEGDAKATKLKEIQTAIDTQNEIAERFLAVLAAWKSKGGSVEDYEKYADAVSASALDAAANVSDVTGAWTFVRDWVTSEKGGIQLGLSILQFLITLFAFKILAGILARITKKAVGSFKKTSDLLRDFFVNTVRKVTFFIGIVVALSMLGINIAPLVAAIGAAGFVIGFALQGTLSNFASGIMILLYRPYDIGNVVTVGGVTGKVHEMSLVSTTVKTPDNQSVVVPNGSIWGGVITNITGNPTRRVDMTFGIGYEDDIDKAEKLLMEIITAHPKVLKDPAPVVKLGELADSSVNFVCRPWSATADYWDVFWDVTKEVKRRFDAEGISIPYPQQDVHMHQAG